MNEKEGCLLRIFIGESDRHDGKPLYEWLVQQAREANLAGTTVLRGMEGFGRTSHIHKDTLLSLNADLPIILEIIDQRERLETFMEHVAPAIKGGLATIEKVEILLYQAEKGSQTS
jgi:hypothetical protein